MMSMPMPRIMFVSGSPLTNDGKRLMSVTPSACWTNGTMALVTEGIDGDSWERLVAALKSLEKDVYVRY
jgi:hypothetical protein